MDENPYEAPQAAQSAIASARRRSRLLTAMFLLIASGGLTLVGCPLYVFAPTDREMIEPTTIAVMAAGLFLALASFWLAHRMWQRPSTQLTDHER